MQENDCIPDGDTIRDHNMKLTIALLTNKREFLLSGLCWQTEEVNHAIYCIRD